MSDKRYLGNIITQNPTAPSGPYEDSTAPGVWSLAEAFAYSKAGLWPTAGNANTLGLFAGGSDLSGTVTAIESFQINTGGTASSFGDLSVARQYGHGLGSATRAVAAGGYSPNSDVMDFVEFASGGTASDFGNLTVARRVPAALGNSTRGCIAGGYTNQAVNVIDYITIASAGDASDFGDLNNSTSQTTAVASTTRGVVGGGGAVSPTMNVIQYITIASTGNATDFGDLTVARQTSAGGASNATRGLFGGNGSNLGNVIDYITIASTGNATDFGDLSASRRYPAGMASSTIAVWGGGDANDGTGTNLLTLIDKVTISSTGNAADYGDLSAGKQSLFAMSSVHGGL